MESYLLCVFYIWATGDIILSDAIQLFTGFNTPISIEKTNEEQEDVTEFMTSHKFKEGVVDEQRDDFLPEKIPDLEKILVSLIQPDVFKVNEIFWVMHYGYFYLEHMSLEIFDTIFQKLDLKDCLIFAKYIFGINFAYKYKLYSKH